MVPEEGEVWAQVRVGWTVKLVLGRGGGVLVTSAASGVCVSPGLVGDTRGEGQGKGTAPQRGGLAVQAAVRFGTWRQKWGVSAVSTTA